jgi:hypothetical protein
MLCRRIEGRLLGLVENFVFVQENNMLRVTKSLLPMKHASSGIHVCFQWSTIPLTCVGNFASVENNICSHIIEICVNCILYFLLPTKQYSIPICWRIDHFFRPNIKIDFLTKIIDALIKRRLQFRVNSYVLNASIMSASLQFSVLVSITFFSTIAFVMMTPGEGAPHELLIPVDAE